MNKKKGRIGSSFEDHLKEQGTLEETNAVAAKRAFGALIRTCSITQLRRDAAELATWLKEPGRVLQITRYGKVVAVALGPVTYDELVSATT